MFLFSKKLFWNTILKYFKIYSLPTSTTLWERLKFLAEIPNSRKEMALLWSTVGLPHKRGVSLRVSFWQLRRWGWEWLFLKSWLPEWGQCGCGTHGHSHFREVLRSCLPSVFLVKDYNPSHFCIRKCQRKSSSSSRTECILHVCQQGCIILQPQKESAP